MDKKELEELIKGFEDQINHLKQVNKTHLISKYKKIVDDLKLKYNKKYNKIDIPDNKYKNLYNEIKKIDIIDIPDIPEINKKNIVSSLTDEDKEILTKVKDKNYFLSFVKTLKLNVNYDKNDISTVKKIFNLINSHLDFTIIHNKFKSINFTTNAQNYIFNWLDTKYNKSNAKLEDIILLIIYPRILKDNKKINTLLLLLFSIYITSKDLSYSFNQFTIIKIFMSPLVNVWNKLKLVIPKISKLYNNIEYNKYDVNNYKIDYNKNNDNETFLYDYLNIKIMPNNFYFQGNFKKKEEEMDLLDQMYYIINENFLKKDILNKFKKIKFKDNTYNYILDWLHKIINKKQKIRLVYLVLKIIYPKIKEDNKKIDDLTLLLFSINLSVYFKGYVNYDLIKTPYKSIQFSNDPPLEQFNSYYIMLIFKLSDVWDQLLELPEMKDLYNEYLEIINYIKPEFNTEKYLDEKKDKIINKLLKQQNKIKNVKDNDINNLYNEINNTKINDKIDIPKIKKDNNKKINNLYDEINNTKINDKIDIPKTKKDNNKKINKLFDEINNTKINDKIDIPKIKKDKNKDKKTEEIKYNKYTNKLTFFGDWLGIKRVKKEIGIDEPEMKLINGMYDIINNHFKQIEVLNKMKNVNFTTDAQYSIMNWLEKKNNKGSAELTDFIILVVYPRLKKDNLNIDNLYLLLYSIELSVDLKYIIEDGKNNTDIDQFNSYRITKIFFTQKISGIWNYVKNLDGFKAIYDEYVKDKYGKS